MEPIRLLINGSKGRMGQAVIACAAEEPGLEIGAAIDAGDDFAAALPSCAVVIDFSHHSTLEFILARCVEKQKPLVIGTTGHSEAQLAAIQHAAQQIPIVHAPNFSIGVNTLFWLTRKAAEILGPSFDLEVVEMHHRLKKDAPSGTRQAARGDPGGSRAGSPIRTTRGTGGRGSSASGRRRRSACTRCAAAMWWAITP